MQWIWVVSLSSPCLFHFFLVLEPFFSISIFHETEMPVWPQTCDGPASVLLVLEIQKCTIQISFIHWFRIVLCLFAYTCVHTCDMGVHVCVCISSTYTMTPFSNQDVVIQPVVCTCLINIDRICEAVWNVMHRVLPAIQVIQHTRGL